MSGLHVPRHSVTWPRPRPRSVASWPGPRCTGAPDGHRRMFTARA